MKIKDITIENRPRERLLRQGASVLSDAELLAVILQNGCVGENAVDLSHRLISLHGLERLNCLSLSELQKIKGIGIAKASKVMAAFELSKRVNAGRIHEKVIRNSSDIAHYYKKLGIF